MLASPSNRLGRYRIGPRIGLGGTATVYAGELGGLGGFSRRVAVKVLHPHLCADGKNVQRFLNEARFGAQLEHRNVLPVLDVGREGELVYLVTEYNHGCSLAELCVRLQEARTDLDRNLAALITREVLLGLEALHTNTGPQGEPHPLMHRDISPQNVLISRDGRVRISDFGLAKLLTDASNLTTQDVVRGKVPYIAPEQAMQGEEGDGRADIWAVGVLFWELLARRSVFPGMTSAAMLQQLLCYPLPRLREAWFDAPDDVVELLQRATTRRPQDRWPSAAAMRQQLERCWPEALMEATRQSLIEAVALHGSGNPALSLAQVAAPTSNAHPVPVSPPAPGPDTLTVELPGPRLDKARRDWTRRYWMSGLTAATLTLLAGWLWTDREAPDNSAESVLPTEPSKDAVGVASASGVETERSATQSKRTPLANQRVIGPTASEHTVDQGGSAGLRSQTKKKPAAHKATTQAQTSERLAPSVSVPDLREAQAAPELAGMRSAHALPSVQGAGALHSVHETQTTPGAQSELPLAKSPYGSPEQ